MLLLFLLILLFILFINIKNQIKKSSFIINTNNRGCFFYGCKSY